MKKTFTIFASIVLCSSLCIGVVFAGTEAKVAHKSETMLTKEERIFGLVTIYHGAKQHFAYFEQVPELDWDKAFMDYLPLVEKEQSLLEYYKTLRRFTVLLHDGHTFVSIPDSITTLMGNLPLNLGYIEEQWVVIERLPTEEIVKDDIPPGSVILTIEGAPAADYIEKDIFCFVHGGTLQGKNAIMNKMRFFPSATHIHLKLRYPDGSIHSRSLNATSKNNLIKWNMERFKKYLWPWHQPSRFSRKTLNDNVLYVLYGSCSKGVEVRFAELIESMEVPLPKAMILDVRGNAGGSTPVKTVRHLISKPVKWYLVKTPCSISYADARMQAASENGRSKEEIANEIFDDFPEYSPGWYSFSSETIEPEKSHYDGPLVILTDRWTSSAAEDLVVLLHGNDRATVIGEPTFGSTGQPIFFNLPGGGKVQICTAVSNYPDGKDFIGVGVQPDIPVKRTIKGIAEGRDEVLEAALDYIRSVNHKKTEQDN